jgi:alcohol dehydrogenase class IV
MNYEIRKFVAPEFIFGVSSIEQTGRYVSNFGAERPMLVTDQGIIESGWTQRVLDQLKEQQLEPVVFSDISPNPRDYQVMQGADIYNEHGCDLIIAIGGGSVMDCAKAIGIVATNGLHVKEFEGVDNVEIPGPPLICIPTTAGTSADVSQFSIINDTQRRIKFAIISTTMVPDIALIDPEITTTMPPFLSVCTGMDALVHAIEAFVSTASSAMTDIHAQEAIRLLWTNLPKVISHPNDHEIRTHLMQGSLQAGLAFSNASLGAVHSMAHCLGGYLDLPHGECNSLLLDHVINYNYRFKPERFNQISTIMGLDLKGKSTAQKKDLLIGEIRNLRQKLGINGTLSQRGLSADDIGMLAMNALSDPCMVTNPGKAKQKDIEVIYEEAL